MAEQIPLVDYLVLGDDPHLIANQCTGCGARFFDRRNAAPAAARPSYQSRCADQRRSPRLHHRGLRGTRDPGSLCRRVVDCDGTSVRANLINVEPDPEHVSLGMKVRLATQAVGTDARGTEAIGFGFEPQEVERRGVR